MQSVMYFNFGIQVATGVLLVAALGCLVRAFWHLGTFLKIKSRSW